MDQLENCILLELWESVLERFNKTPLKLQSADLDLNAAVALLESLLTTTLQDSLIILKARESCAQKQNPTRRRQVESACKV